MRTFLIFILIVLGAVLYYVLTDFTRVFEKSTSYLRDQRFEDNHTFVTNRKPSDPKTMVAEPTPTPVATPQEAEILAIDESRIPDEIDESLVPEANSGQIIPYSEEERGFKIGICHTYLGYCRNSDIVFNYGTEYNPRSAEKEKEVVECVTEVSKCLDNAQEITLEEEVHILETYAK